MLCKVSDEKLKFVLKCAFQSHFLNSVQQKDCLVRELLFCIVQASHETGRVHSFKSFKRKGVPVVA